MMTNILESFIQICREMWEESHSQEMDMKAPFSETVIDCKTLTIYVRSHDEKHSVKIL